MTQVDVTENTQQETDLNLIKSISTLYIDIPIKSQTTSASMKKHNLTICWLQKCTSNTNTQTSQKPMEGKWHAILIIPKKAGGPILMFK